MVPGMESLNHKEITAIELKYLGNSVQDISDKLEIPFDTANGWFKSSGKLSTLYGEYVEYMNRKRQSEFENKVSVSDEEFFILTTNIVRRISQQVAGMEVHLVDSEGNVVAGPDGLPVMVKKPPQEFSVADLERIWKIQRIMRGLNTSHEKQDIEQTNFEADVLIKELGLTDDDFTDEHIEATSAKIRNHILAQ